MVIAICDESRSDRSYLREMLKAYSVRYAVDFTIQEYGSTAVLDRVLKSGADILFLDTGSGSPPSGIQAGRMLRRRGYESALIFTSRNVSHSVEGYRAQALRYLLKPIHRETLEEALGAARETVCAVQKRIPLRSAQGAGTVYLAPKQIVAFESYYREKWVFMQDGSRYSTPLTFAQIESRLPCGLFACPHKSFLVNLSQVVRYKAGCITMSNGMDIKVSRGRRPAFEEMLTHFTGQPLSPAGLTQSEQSGTGQSGSGLPGTRQPDPDCPEPPSFITGLCATESSNYEPSSSGQRGFKPFENS